ncbi:MAG: sensor histidine kinase [Lachnospiraceae bacterium]
MESNINVPKAVFTFTGEKEGDIIRLTVRDDGVGMDEEELEQLRQQIEKPCQETEKGFGLANVNERIHMYFGPEYGMKIQSQKGKELQWRL